MFAHRVEFNIFNNYHFVRVGWKQGIINDGIDIQTITLHEETHRVCGSSRGIDETWSFGVFSDRFDYVQVFLFHCLSMRLEIINDGYPTIRINVGKVFFMANPQILINNDCSCSAP